jgi:hemoglobin-like flavoprotein
MITPEQVQQVQSSFTQLLPMAEAVGEMLYSRIFELAPEARALFKEDIRPQAKRTMAAVKVAVEGLDRLDDVAPFLIRLGARHVNYGVRPEHFTVVGEALLWTLEEGLGDSFTPELRDAWAAAWDVVAGAMVSGLRQAEAELDAADLRVA